LKLTTRMPCNRSSMRPSAFLAAGEALIRPPEHATGLDFGDVAWPREWLRRGLARSALAPNLGKEGVEPAGHEQGKEGQGLGPGIDPLVPAVVADENRRARRHRMVLAVDLEKALAGNDIGGLVVLIVGVLANETTRSDRLHAQRIFVHAAGHLVVEEVAGEAVGRYRLPIALALVGAKHHRPAQRFVGRCHAIPPLARSRHDRALRVLRQASIEVAKTAPVNCRRARGRRAWRRSCAPGPYRAPNAAAAAPPRRPCAAGRRPSRASLRACRCARSPPPAAARYPASRSRSDRDRAYSPPRRASRRQPT